MLNEWYDRNYEARNIPNGKLIENQDFQLSNIFNGSSEEASVFCSCGVKVQIAKVHENFSLSKYYKHIKPKSCGMIKKKNLYRQS